MAHTRRTILGSLATVAVAGCLGSGDSVEPVIDKTIYQTQIFRFDIEKGDEITVDVVNETDVVAGAQLFPPDPADTVIQLFVEDEDSDTHTARRPGGWELHFSPGKRAYLTVTIN